MACRKKQLSKYPPWICAVLCPTHQCPYPPLAGELFTFDLASGTSVQPSKGPTICRDQAPAGVPWPLLMDQLVQGKQRMAPEWVQHLGGLHGAIVSAPFNFLLWKHMQPVSLAHHPGPPGKDSLSS